VSLTGPEPTGGARRSGSPECGQRRCAQDHAQGSAALKDPAHEDVWRRSATCIGVCSFELVRPASGVVSLCQQPCGARSSAGL